MIVSENDKMQIFVSNVWIKRTIPFQENCVSLNLFAKFLKNVQFADMDTLNKF